LNCKPKDLQIRIFHVYLRDGSTGTYNATGRVEIVGEASAANALELYGHQYETDWALGRAIYDQYEYLVVEKGTETADTFIIKPQPHYTVEVA